VRGLERLDAFGRAHHGLVTLTAWTAAGMAGSGWYRAAQRGELCIVHPGVARLATSPTSRLQALHAAVLAAGPGAMASHGSAIELWDIPYPARERIDVIVPRSRHPVPIPGIAVHRPDGRTDLVPVRRHGIPTCPLLQALSDLGAVDPAAVDGAVGHVLTEGRVSASALTWVTSARSRRGRVGVAQLRAALDDWLLDGKVLDSELEKAMRALRRRFALPAMTFHAICAGYEVDFLVDGTPVVIECDSLKFHDSKRDDFERDRRKKADLAAAGYVTVPITYRQITREPTWVVATIWKAAYPWLTA